MEAERAVGQVLAKLPAKSVLMMNTGTHVGALQFADVHLKRTVNESTFIAWDAARSAPAAVVDFVIAWDNDDVARAVRQNPRGLQMVTQMKFGDITASIYRSEWRGGKGIRDQGLGISKVVTRSKRLATVCQFVTRTFANS